MTEGGPGPEEAERVRGYLLAQGTKYSWEELWPRIVGTRAALIDSLAGVSDEQGNWEPGTGEGEEAWGITQIVRHVISAGDSTLSSTEALANGKRPPERAPDDLKHKTLSDLMPDLIDSSERLATIRSRVPNEPNMTETSPHNFFGELTSKAWFLFLRVHDTDHLNQINAVKEMDGYPTG